MLTAVTAVEGVINSRPLLYISSLDIEEPLTPSHLLVKRRMLNLQHDLDSVPDPNDEDFEINASQLTKRMKHLANLIDHFWKQWRPEYLSELRERHQYQAKKNPTSVPNIKKRDIVIVHDESLPRGLWKLCRVQEVLTGRDGLPRGALVRVAVQRKQQKLLKRPLKLLYPLEITPSEIQWDNTAESDYKAESDSTDSTSQPAHKTRRPRAAAERAEVKRKMWIRELQSTTDE